MVIGVLCCLCMGNACCKNTKQKFCFKEKRLIYFFIFFPQYGQNKATCIVGLMSILFLQCEQYMWGCVITIEKSKKFKNFSIILNNTPSMMVPSFGVFIIIMTLKETLVVIIWLPVELKKK